MRLGAPVPVDRIVRAAGMPFRTITTGAATEAPTFVLVHGIGVWHRCLARLHEQLSASGTVLSIDLPGFGGLPKSENTPRSLRW